MADKTISTRIIQKHDTTDNWNKATNFVPKLGELILYTDVNKIKMGDGVTNVIQLPFLSADVELDRPTVVEALGFMPAAEDTDTHRPVQMNGTQILGDNKDPLNLKAGTNVSLSNNSGTVTITATDTNTHRPIQMDGTEILSDNTTPLNLEAGSNVSLSNSSGTITINATDTKDLSSMTGILPLSKGGSGTTFASANAYALVRVGSDKNQLYYTNVGKGAAYTTAADSELSFGNLPLDLGGTGRNISIYPGNSIIRMSSDPDTYPYVMYTPTNKGAFYCSTAADPDNNTYPSANFGTLPVACGGTGADDADTARSNLGIKDIFYYGTNTQEGNVTAKTVSCTGFKLVTGATIAVKFSNTHTVSGMTLNVNGTGAKTVYYNGAAIPVDAIRAYNTYLFTYDGSYYRVTGITPKITYGTTAPSGGIDGDIYIMY